MKNQVAASAVAIASLAREGFEPPGDLVFIASADEEVGKAFGLQWLCEEHPDAVRVDYAINEGGGERVVLGDRAFYLLAAAEKMTAPIRLTVHGRSGHGSMPGIADNALVKAAPLIEKLAAYRPEPSIGPEVAGFLEAVLGEVPEPRDVLTRLAAVDSLAVETIEPLLSLTLSPTMIGASERRNVIPGTCEVVVDRRLLPGQTPEDVEPILRGLLGEGDYDLETLERWGGTRSELDTPLWRGDLRLGRADRPRHEAGAALLPRVHRLALAARRVRHGRVRVLPDADDGGRGRRAPDPLRRRADARRRPRAGRRVPPHRRALAGVARMLELRSPDGAFERIEAYLRERGFFAPGGEELEADLYLGYGLSAPLRRRSSPLPPEPCPLPLAAVAIRPLRTGPGSDPGQVRIGQWERSWSDADYAHAVESVRDAIGRGDVYQVNLVQHLSAPFGGDAGTLAARLDAFGARMLAGDGWAIVSASPELFLARRDRRVWTCPIKGTRPLGEHVEGEKDAAEHVMIVDLERNDLSRVCEPGSVRWPELMAERELAGVTHLVSTVEGRLREDVGLAELLAATFPGGSVTGAPKIAAVDLIAELEHVGRGASMGALGVVHGNGDLELALTIRTFAIAAGKLHLWVGGGIVWDSDPEAEIEESWTKARPLLAAIGAPIEAVAR